MLVGYGCPGGHGKHEHGAQGTVKAKKKREKKVPRVEQEMGRWGDGETWEMERSLEIHT